MSMYRFTLSSEIPTAELGNSLLLAFIAVEGLHGESACRIEARIAIDRPGSCVVDAGTPVGRDLAKIITGVLRRQYDADQYQIERLTIDPFVGGIA